MFSLRQPLAVRSRAAGASRGGKGRGVGGAASVPRACSPWARAPPALGPPRGCKDDRRGGGGGRALSGTCRSPRYGAARALVPCLSATTVAAGVWLAGPGPRCRAARWVSWDRGTVLWECPVVRAARRTSGSGAPVSADPEPCGRLHCGGALAAPSLQPALAGGVAVTSPGLGDGSFASVYQDLGFDVRSLRRLISRSTGIPME